MQLLIKFITALLAKLPLGMVFALGKALGWIYGSVIRYHRRDAFANLQRSFPEKSDVEIQSIVRQMYRNFGMNLVEILRLAGGTLDEFKNRIAVEGRDIIDHALQRGKGAVILTAHFGNWDLLGMFTVKHGYKLTIISKDLKSKTINAMWMLLREKFGVNIIPAHQSVRASLKILRQNELLGFILDQNRPREQGIFVDFFGRPACTSPGLAIIASQTQAPIVPVFIHRTPEGNHVLQILPIIEPPPDREPETIRQATQAYTKIIEDQIRQYPEQWIWLHRRWKTQSLTGTS
jgi:KDO2-lipid IV(A) lauroyltransferase